MDKFTTQMQRYIRRIKVADHYSNKAQNKSANPRTIGKRQWAAISVFAVVALIAGSILVASRKLSNSQASLALTTPALYNPQTTPGAYSTSADGQPSAAWQDKSAGGASLDAAGTRQQASNTTLAPPETGQTQAKSWDRKIIRTATLQLTVKNVTASVDRVQLLAAQHGGYVFQSDSHQDGDHTVSSITIQVPTQEFDRIMPELRKLDGQVSKITSENVSSSDVTEEYTDLGSQLRNLQATEARILALQQKAEKLEDVLTLDQQLRQVQGDIERVQGRLNFLSNHSDMSSITVSLSPIGLPAPAIEPEPVKAWDPGQIAIKAWNASLDMLSGIATVAITIAVFLWWAVPMLVVLYVLVMRGRRRAGGTGRGESTPPAPPTSTVGETGAV